MWHSIVYQGIFIIVVSIDYNIQVIARDNQTEQI